MKDERIPKIGDVVTTFGFKNGVVFKIVTDDDSRYNQIWARYSANEEAYTPLHCFLDEPKEAFIVKRSNNFRSMPGYNKLFKLQESLSQQRKD